MSTRVLLADDHAMIRDGLRIFLEREGFTVIAEASDGAEAVRHAAQHSPDLAIVDIGMPVLNGLDAAVEIVRVSPETKVILLTMHAEDEYATTAFKCGVSGYVLKTQLTTELVRAVREVEQGRTYISPAVSGAVVRGMLNDKNTAPKVVLSTRERQVLQLIAQGMSTKALAHEIDISVRTAESHRANIMQKLGIRETAGLVRYAIRTGLVKA